MTAELLGKQPGLSSAPTRQTQVHFWTPEENRPTLYKMAAQARAYAKAGIDAQRAARRWGAK